MAGTLIMEQLVFPTRVGVIPPGIAITGCGGRIPHTGGGDPYILNRGSAMEKYSPHGWG